MKFDTIIIGGGLSGLVAGIKLASSRKKVALITSGQSALNFSSGSFGLLSEADGKEITRPLEHISDLEPDHPYFKIAGASPEGNANCAESLRKLAEEAKSVLQQAGIEIVGSADANHFALTPLGELKPAWLSLNEIMTCSSPESFPYRKALIVNFSGFVDFFPEYLAEGLKKLGVECNCKQIDFPELMNLRRGCPDMRAASYAKILTGDALKKLAERINELADDAECVLLPAVIGLESNSQVDELASRVKRPVRYIPILPMSAFGVRLEFMLRHCFQRLGGTYLLGDSVKAGKFDDRRLKSVHTQKLGDTPLEADNFILSTGSFFSHGLVATPSEITEPVFGLDVVQTATRPERYSKDFFAPQPYMKFGVVTDSDFLVSRGGKKVENLRAIGSILPGADSLTEGSGAGVALLSALKAASLILAGK